MKFQKTGVAFVKVEKINLIIVLMLNNYFNEN